ncbi:MAG TPA: hypothetical protein QGF58_31060 [Myxococcota bacterium]|nr:hypothetical protein [Myxococcota bacterium]
MRVLIETDTGQYTEGEGRYVEHADGTRTAKAAAFAIGGLVLGACAIFIPIVHFFATWLFPLIGFVMAWRTFQTEAEILDINALCPSCEREVVIPGGAVTERRLEDQCPECMRPLRIKEVHGGKRS